MMNMSSWIGQDLYLLTRTAGKITFCIFFLSEYFLLFFKNEIILRKITHQKTKGILKETKLLQLGVFVAQCLVSFS